MTVPTCPVHGTPMRESKFGGFYCGRKEGEGYCNVKYKPDAKGEARQPSLPARPPSQGTSRDARAIAALAFAGHLYQGFGPQALDEALECARKALRIFDEDMP